MLDAFINARVLAGDAFETAVAVLVEDGRIIAVVPDTDPRVRGARTHDLGGATLVPGFVDCQVNGGGDMLFNDAPDAATIARIAMAHRRYGTTALLPTLISDTHDKMVRAIEAAERAIADGVPGVIGVHLEGPYLAEARRGVHDAAKLRDADDAELAAIRPVRGGTTLVTLAPERVTPRAIAALVARGVIVALGHTAASYETVRACLDAGARGFTHLYNAMPPLSGRDPGPVGAALDDRASWCGVIADGHHVHAASLRIAINAKPRGKVFLVSDAMPPVGGDRDAFTLGDAEVVARDGRLTTADGTLAGSTLEMATAVRYAANALGVPLAEAARMASTYPATFLGLEAVYGRISPGYRADFAVLDGDLRVRATYVAGARSFDA